VSAALDLAWMALVGASTGDIALALVGTLIGTVIGLAIVLVKHGERLARLEERTRRLINSKPSAER
jgi:hypothetical protein